MGPSTAVRINLGMQSKADLSDDEIRLDGSYIAHESHNWLLYGGYTDQWWGPGWVSSMILSANARPFSRAGVMRTYPTAFETPVLSWLGPWPGNACVGVLEADGRTVAHTLPVGNRLQINPAARLASAATRLLSITVGKRSGRG